MQNSHIKKLKMRSLLSFGPEETEVDLGRLNVLIGPNGSGKSNLIECLGLLRSAPTNLSAPVKESGGVRDWLWKGHRQSTAMLEAVAQIASIGDMAVRHRIEFVEHGSRFEITGEAIENECAYQGYDRPWFYYRNENGHVRLADPKSTRETAESERSNDPENGGRSLPREQISPEESVLSQVKDPERYPVFAQLSRLYSEIRLYREWAFGRYTPPRAEADSPPAETSRRRSRRRTTNIPSFSSSTAKRRLADASPGIIRQRNSSDLRRRRMNRLNR